MKQAVDLMRINVLKIFVKINIESSSVKTSIKTWTIYELSITMV